MRCPLAVRIQQRGIPVLSLEAGNTELRKSEGHCSISLMCLTLSMLSPLWTVFHCSASKECDRDIARRTLDNMFANGSVSPVYLRMASAVWSCSVNGTLFLSIRLAKFLFALDSWRVIPPRNNALAPPRCDPRPCDDPPPYTGPAGVVAVPALDSCPWLASIKVEKVS